MRRCWAAVALLFGLSGLAHAERIICIGDSITQGGARSQDYTYRLPLQSMLNADFIGTRRTGLDPAVKWPDGFDPDHEGYYGATSAQVRDRLKLTLPRLPPPDLALVYLGTNDGFGETVEPLESIIRQLRARNPQVRVFVGVATHGWKSLYTGITLGRMARRLGVTLVKHTYRVADTFDGVHPNPSGQLKMAAAWFAAISRKDSNDKVEKVARLGSDSGWIVGRDVERRMGRSRSIGTVDGLRPNMGRKYLTTVVATPIDRRPYTLQDKARGERRGLWADPQPVAPWEWRSAAR